MLLHFLVAFYSMESKIDIITRTQESLSVMEEPLLTREGQGLE